MTDCINNKKISYTQTHTHTLSQHNTLYIRQFLRPSDFNLALGTTHCYRDYRTGRLKHILLFLFLNFSLIRKGGPSRLVPLRRCSYGQWRVLLLDGGSSLEYFVE